MDYQQREKKVEQELVLQFNCCWSDEGRSKSELAVYWKSLQNSERSLSFDWKLWHSD